ncbi:MAG TPA: ABC transporter permease [Terracidiphilus sp.]|jgi:predicted permease
MSWVRRLFTRKQMEAELDKELRFHFESQVADKIRSGVPESEARRLTRIEFGGIEQIKEDCRERRGTMWIESILQDVRYALRQLGKTPVFTTTVLLTLVLGIGANSAIFTLVNAILQKNLPVADPGNLVRLGDANDCCVGTFIPDSGSVSYFSTDDYEQLKKNTPEFEELAAMQAGFGARPVTARRGGTDEMARSVMGEFVSGNYFRTFGLQPEAGRLFIDADDEPGAPMVAVMSYETWRHIYGGDPSVVGSTFLVNTKPVTIVGIAPRGFYGDRLFPNPPEFYLPVETMPVLANVTYVHNPDQQWLYIIGRLKPGVAILPLQDKLSSLLRQVFAARKKFTSTSDQLFLSKIHIAITPGEEGIQAMQEWFGSQLHLLMWVACLVLLIACANIANLLLVRGMGRRAEMSVRTALGAVRGRIVRQLLTESLLLAGLGGIAGLAVSYAGTRMLLMLALPGAKNVPIEAHPSLPVLAFAMGLSLLTGVLFGVAPAWIAAQARPADALRTGSRTSGAGASLLQRGLVVLQVGLSLVLLVGAALFLESLTKLEGTDLRLNSKNRYIVHINPQTGGYVQTQLEALYRTLEERFHAVPGVTKVGIASYTPMENDNNGWDVFVQGQPYLDVEASRIRMNAEYFESVGTHVVMGRGIGVRDTATAPTVAVVNEAFVKKLFKPGESPIGRHFGIRGPTSSGDWEIVGVAEDTAYTNARWKDHAMFFIPLMQREPSLKEPIDKDESLYAGAIVLETDRPMDEMEEVARRTLAGINPNLTVVKFQTFEDQIADRFSGERMISRLTLLFGGLALLLASIGLYGVTAYSVARRVPEIGIRMALGAERGGVVAMILRGALIQTVLGLAIGIPVALLSVKFLRSQLYEITTADSRVMISAIVTLVAAAFIAIIVPARRAASIDPVQALRME